LAAGLGDSPGGGLTGAPPPPIEGAGGTAGVAGGAVELLGVGGEGIGDGNSEDAGLGALVISGVGTGGDGRGDGVFAWPLVNKAVPIP